MGYFHSNNHKEFAQLVISNFSKKLLFLLLSTREFVYNLQDQSNLISFVFGKYFLGGLVTAEPVLGVVPGFPFPGWWPSFGLLFLKIICFTPYLLLGRCTLEPLDGGLPVLATGPG